MPVLSPTHNFFPTNKTCLASMAKKRVSKRDRHSKIFTRQGPRDRRMRLSLEIARKFFDLQDMLGFDKASKTVGWLLNKSKAAIRELSKDLTEADASSSGGGGAVGDRSASSMSECEVISRGIEETIDNVGLAENGEKSTHKVKKSRLLRKTTFHPLAKESRAMARAKARERTEEKIRNRKLEGCTGTAPSYLNPSRSSSPGKARKESGSLNDNYDNSSLGLVNELGEPISHPFGHQAAIHSMVDESIPTSGEAVNSIFDYHHQGVNSDNHLVSLQNNDMINFFSDNWEMDGPRMHSNYCVVPNIHSPTNDTHGRVTSALFKASSSSDHGNVQSHFTDVQFCPKSWDAYNNQNLC